MKQPVLSIVIPTRDRPRLLRRAVASALAQEDVAVEVIVVDDGSDPPAELPPQPTVKLVRLGTSRGNAAARNAGAQAAKGRLLAFLDDDDELLPGFAATALAALTDSRLPAPVAVLSAMEVVDASGKVIEVRRPPTLQRGCHFFLEEPQPGSSYLSKQTLVVERSVLLAIGGYDEAFRSRVPSEMFLRLNPVCSLQGTPVVTYRQHRHEGPRLSRDPSLRSRSFEQLLAKHKASFAAHPRGYARFLMSHAAVLRRQGEVTKATMATLQALRVAPGIALRALHLPWPLARRWRRDPAR
jgi:glycosyltransferase involved in cell wall biosynthesis